MTISIKKTKCKLPCKLNPKENHEQVKNFKCSRIDFSRDRSIYQEVKHKTIKGARVSRYICGLICKNKYISVDSKVKMYDTDKTNADIWSGNSPRTSRTKYVLCKIEMQ